MKKYSVRDVVSDYGVYDEKGNLEHMLILNSKTNALLVADILNADEKNAVYIKAISPCNCTEAKMACIRAEKENEQLKEIIANLIKQVEINDYKDSIGHPLKMNLYFCAAKELMNNYMEVKK